MPRPCVGVRSAGSAARSILDRPGFLLGLAAVIAAAAFELWITPSNPPGYHRDEASVSHNAYSISTSLRDEDGGFLPLFRSFDDYKSPLYPYLLAAVFRVTGPNAEVARGMSAVLVLIAVLLVALLAKRLTGRSLVAVVTLLLAAATPWLFEVGRVAFEYATQPVLIALLLLATERAWRRKRWTVGEGVLIGCLLGVLVYSYAGNRLLSPLLAGALAVFAGRGRWRWLVAAWGAFAAFLLPLGVYALRHPGALTARYDATTIAREGQSGLRVVLQGVANWFHDIDPWHWATAGDPAPYVHNGAYGAVYGAVVALAVAGTVILLIQRRRDLWWRYVLVATALAPIPAALTVDRHNAGRLTALPVLFLVLAIPALNALLEAGRRQHAARVVIALLALTVAVQFLQFLDSYRTRGPGRTVLYEAGVEPLLAEAFAIADKIYIDYDDRRAQAHARWFAAESGVSQDRVEILPDGGIPPSGSTVFGLFQECDYVCRRFAHWEQYWLAKAIGPRPG